MKEKVNIIGNRFIIIMVFRTQRNAQFCQKLNQKNILKKLRLKCININTFG